MTNKLIESTELNPTDADNDVLIGFKPKLRNYSKYKQDINTCKSNQITKVFTSSVKDGDIVPTQRNWIEFD